PSTGARSIDYCPEGWYYYKLSCFRYFSQPQTWEEAERQCQTSYSGAHLAWVEEPREATTLQKAISYYQRVQHVWIGLHYSQENRSWQWSSGDKYSATRGLDGNGAQGGKCGLLTHSSGFTVWYSADCSQHHHYICKFTP
ncbi:REG4 protein, partial [Turnix velox]|nr:REG4 protein [Turnix velox]